MQITLFCSDLLDLYEKASNGGKLTLESFLELAENHDIQVCCLLSFSLLSNCLESFPDFFIEVKFNLKLL